MEDRFILAELEASFINPRDRRGSYQKLFDPVVGALLAQVAYWTLPAKSGASKLRVERHGHEWVAKTREEWMEECSLTPNRYRRATAVLREMGLIEVKVMKFKGVTMAHTRLITSALVMRVKGLLSGGIHSSQWVVSTHPYRVRSTHPTGWNPPAVNTDTTEPDMTTDVSSSDALNAVAETAAKTSASAVGESKKENLTEFKKGGKMNAEEILALHKKKQQEKLYGDSKKMTVPFLWQKMCATITGKPQLALTNKQRGQLKQIEKQLGATTPAVVLNTLENWDKYLQRVDAEDGIECGPIVPNIGFLLAHLGVANTLYMQSIAKKESPKVAGQTPVVYAASKEAAPTPDDEDEPLPPDWWEKTLAKFNNPQG